MNKKLYFTMETSLKQSLECNSVMEGTSASFSKSKKYFKACSSV